MQRLSQLARSVIELGEPLPLPFKALKDINVALYPGQVSLFVAASGVGKTTVALNLMRLIRPRRGLYVLVDTDPLDIAARATAMITGRRMPDPDDRLDFIRDHSEARDQALDHIEWYTDGGPSLEDISEEVECYGAVYGAWPELIVVDNLTSVDMEAETSHYALQDAISRFTQCARVTGAHIMILHHATGDYEDGTKIIPKSGIEQKAAKRVSLALTATRLGSTLRVAVVKNRGGEADASGIKVYANLHADLATMRIESV